MELTYNALLVVIIRLDRIVQHLSLDCPIKSGNDVFENIYETFRVKMSAG
jgi:hypothetical protein